VKVGRHIHFKDGKFAIWSTVVDRYVTAWSKDENWIIAEWLSGTIFAELPRIQRGLADAKEHGCSAGKPARCTKEGI